MSQDDLVSVVMRLRDVILKHVKQTSVAMNALSDIDRLWVALNQRRDAEQP